VSSTLESHMRADKDSDIELDRTTSNDRIFKAVYENCHCSSRLHTGIRHSARLSYILS
jgi:hypothetical protein